MLYDCFTFFNELELLELRLNELAGVVDKFVLVESTRTFTNKPKPLHFQENRARFSAFADKIIHVVVADMPDKDNPWLLEHFQRNAIVRGLKQGRPDDLVMVSDLDEIPRATTVSRAKTQIPNESSLAHAVLNSWLIKCLSYPKDLRWQLRKKHPYIWKFRMHTFNYYLNCRQMEPAFCFGTRLLRYRDYSSAEEIRHSGYQIIEDGGWHFSYMGGAERIRQKVAAYAHQEYNQPQFMELSALEASINRGENLFNKDWQLKFVPLDDSFPRYILEHRDQFSSWIKLI